MKADFGADQTQKSDTVPSGDNFIAAVDLGSNSFHLVIAKVDSDRLIVVDRIREVVRLGGGLDQSSNLNQETSARAIDCLQRFGQRLRDIPPDNIRAVGTNTFRKARNIQDFLPAAQAALGHKIEVIPGREEARLIYKSVSYGSPDSNQKQLVIDIGGGSTEIIAGSDYEPNCVESLHIGCVSLTSTRFPGGHISYDCMAMAILDAQLEVRAVHRQFVEHGWGHVVGCSGTIRAVANSLSYLGLNDGHIGRRELNALRERMVQYQHVSELSKLGFETNRCEVLPGGFAIVFALFELLNIQTMEISDLALREGVLYDLLGRLRNDDVRQRTVESLLAQWSIDKDHAERVRDVALTMYSQVAPIWFSDEPETKNLLAWAALLHEIGLSLTHSKYHVHGGYLLEVSDLAGFSRTEQIVLATLVRFHRRKFDTEFFHSNQSFPRRTIKRLCVLLRVAVLLLRPRTDRIRFDIKCTASRKQLTVEFPPDWLEQHPLTLADLRHEQNYLKSIGYELIYQN